MNINMEIITSKENPHIKLYQKLSSLKKLRDKEDLFVLEGHRIIFDAINEKVPIIKLFLTQIYFEKHEAELSQVDLKGVNILIVSNELGSKMSLTESTQGIFAICKKNSKYNLTEALEDNEKIIVLHKLQDPGNLGMIIRTADALGINKIILSECCDLFSPKVIRATMGSVFRVNIFIENDILKLFEIFKLKKITSYAAVIDVNASSIRNIKFSNKSAVLIGNEGNGLDKEIINICDERITIVMNGNINSLNAAMAAGIIIWQMSER